MEPLISIGIPVKDGFKNKTDNDINLKKALDSVLKQSYQNIEIIISNNCSTDSTKIFLDKISKTDKRIKIFNQKKEISSGENFQFVFDKSKGKYFRWNAADDFMSLNYIKDNFNFLNNNKDYVASSSKFFFENDKNHYLSHNLNENLYSRLKHFFNVRYSSHNVFYSLIRNENLKNITKMSKDYLAIDWMVNLDLLLNGKFKTIEESYIVFGVKGISKSKDFLKNEQYNNKKIYSLLPLYELTKDFFAKTIYMKELSVVQKIYLYYLCIKANLSFLKKRSKKS
ncbi:glycosyltransferase family 2 protein [Candidatus Pelagibacter sp.]|nr:glycosyltransferase family 2 protein [Candidatus Pelagibacter sp.]